MRNQSQDPCTGDFPEACQHPVLLIVGSPHVNHGGNSLCQDPLARLQESSIISPQNALSSGDVDHAIFLCPEGVARSSSSRPAPRPPAASPGAAAPPSSACEKAPQTLVLAIKKGSMASRGLCFLSTPMCWVPRSLLASCWITAPAAGFRPYLCRSAALEFEERASTAKDLLGPFSLVRVAYFCLASVACGSLQAA